MPKIGSVVNKTERVVGSLVKIVVIYGDYHGCFIILYFFNYYYYRIIITELYFLVTVLIFCTNLNANGRNPIEFFVEGKRVMLTS